MAAKNTGKAVVERVSTFAKARTSTPAEIAASEYLQTNGDIEFSEETDLSPEDITACLQKLHGLTSFDEVTQWAKDKPRASLVQLLEARNEKFLPTPRNLLSYDSWLIVLCSSVIFVSLRAQTKAKYEYRHEDKFLKTARSPTPRTSHAATSIRGEKRAGQGRDRNGIPEAQDEGPGTRRVSDELDMFSFEKDLATDIGGVLQQITGRVLNVITDFVSGETTQSALQSARDFGKDALISSGVSSAVSDALKAGADAGTNASTSLALWAGRGLFTPQQTLFITTAFCLIRRRGVLTWLGTLVAIRLYRFVLQIDRQEREWERQVLVEKTAQENAEKQESGAGEEVKVDAQLSDK